MIDWQKFAAYYIGQLGGPNHDTAYHSLIEADNAIVPILAEAFQAEQDAVIRSQLVEVVWQHRLPETIEFLGEVLNDPAPAVWKNALDGLVAIGGQAAVRMLEDAKRRIESGRQSRTEQIEWISEAIQQAQEKQG